MKEIKQMKTLAYITHKLTSSKNSTTFVELVTTNVFFKLLSTNGDIVL